ncbi:sugar ABC transporter permease [Nakamurella sp. A5-74]|uniref:Sugar ABC transporter permease n=1 Tax=Nakamurella sp. A5-74 TaxID=3158264 RepID=A0AAU8DNR8_9ACTN
MSTSTSSVAPQKSKRRHGGTTVGQNRAGWLFVTPVIILLGLFLLAPIVMAFWVSLSDWSGKGSPLGSNVSSVGLDNYTQLLGEDSLTRSDFATSLRNNFYYVIIVVPIQTVLALGLALLLNNRRLKGLSFFRTAYYFPSVTSSVAVASVFLFLFAGGGSINAFLGFFGIRGPQWFSDPRGVGHMILGWFGIGNGAEGAGPQVLTEHGFLSLSWWDWLAGPSVAMTTIIMLVIWVSTGGYMLLFLAALQNIPSEMWEQSSIDGAGTWRRNVSVIIPQIKPTLFTVLTLGLIGTWQVFDQIYIMSKGNPSKTTLTPAFLAYDQSINNGQWGTGTAMAFILFAIILVMTAIQRYVMRDRDKPKRRGRRGAGDNTYTGPKAVAPLPTTNMSGPMS